MKRPRDAHDVSERRVPEAALNSAEVRTVDTRLGGEHFLRPTTLFPQLTNAKSKTNGIRISAPHDGSIVRCSLSVDRL